MFERNKNQRNKFHQKGKGTSQFGFCICPQCDYSVTHKRGVPCFSLLCPRCNIPLIRQAQAGNSNKQQVPNKKNKNSTFPKIDAELCIGCGACVSICSSNAIHLESGKAIISVEKCKKCNACINACPVKAIT